MRGTQVPTRAIQGSEAAIRLVARLVVATLLLAVLTAIALLMVLPRATGATALTVLTGSMTPEIPVGSAVFVRPVDASSLRVGDIATYQKKEGVESFITHRIVDIDTSTKPTSYIFKGDANRGADVKPVPETAIRGEVWFHVPYLGSIRDALNGKAGLSLLATLVLGGYAVTQLASAVRDRRRARRTADPTPRGEVETPLVSDRPVVVAELPCLEADAEDLARILGATVLSASASTCTLLATSTPDEMDDLLARLASHGATGIRVIDAGTSGALLTSTHLPQAANAPEDVTHAQV